MRNLLWEGRRHHFGMPLSFTRYSVDRKRLFCQTGALNLRETEVMLYRIRDIQLYQPLLERIFGLGTIVIYSADRDQAVMQLKAIQNPLTVKELIFELVEEAKKERCMGTTEVVSAYS